MAAISSVEQLDKLAMVRFFTLPSSLVQDAAAARSKRGSLEKTVPTATFINEVFK
jgi:hypothetical protein